MFIYCVHNTSKLPKYSITKRWTKEHDGYLASLKMSMLCATMIKKNCDYVM